MKSENNVFQEILVGLMGEIDKLEIKDEEVQRDFLKTGFPSVYYIGTMPRLVTV